MPERNLCFDKIIDRNNTDCFKYDCRVRRGFPADALPLSVADMDLPVSSYIIDAMAERLKHPVFGYTETGERYFNVLKDWFLRHYGWEVKPEWLIKTPGVVFAAAMAVKAFTGPGDYVIIQQPVYYCFAQAIRDNGRKMVSSTLKLLSDNRYHMDLDDFEEKIVKNNVKLFILCSPHNPAGRVWTKEELTEVGNICIRHGVTVFSDEIHEDFVFKGRHQVFAAINDDFKENCVIATSASKTFNLAGLLHSNIFVPNEQLRKRFRNEVHAAGISQLGTLGIVATEAAYRDGEEWYRAMLSYLRGNIDFTYEYARDRLPGVSMVELEGTYLPWLDFRGTGLTQQEADDLIVHKANLWLDSGPRFGEGGEGFQRINAACPRATLEEALNRIERALKA